MPVTSVTSGRVEPCRERRGEVARLVGVRKEDQRGLLLGDDGGERHHVTVGRVALECRILGHDDALAPRSGELCRRGVERRAQERHAHGAAGLLRGGDGFPRGAIQRAVALLGDDQHAHWITLASSRSFATSCRAASAGGPVSSSVFFAFSGT